MTRRWLATAVVVAATATVAGCAHPLIPAAVLHPRPSTTLRPLPAPRHPTLGVDLYARSNYPLGTVRADGIRDLAYMRHTLGAQAAGIMWNFYSPSVGSTRVEGTSITLSPAAVALLTRQARAQGMRVEYRPLIRVGPQWRWEGFINPPRQQAWFISLYHAELPYLRMAQRLRVSEFVVSTELRALNTSNQWPRFIAKIRHIYHGTVSFVSSQVVRRGYADQSLAREPVRAFGIDPYPPLKVSPSATVSQLLRHWERAFRTLSAGALQRTALDEVGIQAARYAYAAPQHWGKYEGPLDQRVQANWFTTACRFAAANHMRAVYFYNMNLTTDPLHPPYPSPPTFEGKLGARAIHGCLRILRS